MKHGLIVWPSNRTK